MNEIFLKKDAVIPGDREFALARHDVEYNYKEPVYLRKINFLALVKDEKLAKLQTKFNPKTMHLLIALDKEILIDNFLSDSKSINEIEIFFQEYLNLPINEKPNLVQGFEVEKNNWLTHSFSDIPDKAISIINMATVIDLEAKTKKKIDAIRFRGNFIIEGGSAWEEFNWIGKKVKIGNSILEIFKKTQRCAATTVNPDTGIRDINVPKEISSHYGHVDLGVYAKVIKSGSVSLLDKISIVS
ncbi:MAG: MOSC domain-containing protein [Proteobacteria bacterium]|nr:MOSC domain-containing protein [Pseudomonadota bacterium]MDA1134780.1 MOSC domain-containing protein [Pseudomonadota bacterium]